ncbi:hypothetical protein DU66_01830, partial [Methanosarcina mazei]
RGEGSLHPLPKGRGIRDPLRSRCNKNYTSYALKNLFEQTPGGFFITNKQFKEAMVRCNFLPVNKNKLNWEFRISLKSPGLK